SLHARVITESNLTANNCIIFDYYASTDSGLRSNNDTFANVAIMAHVDHVIEFSSLPASCTTYACPIYTRLRTEFNIILDNDRADLWELVITHLITNIAEAVSTNAHTCRK